MKSIKLISLVFISLIKVNASLICAEDGNGKVSLQHVQPSYIENCAVPNKPLVLQPLNRSIGHNNAAQSAECIVNTSSGQNSSNHHNNAMSVPVHQICVPSVQPKPQPNVKFVQMQPPKSAVQEHQPKVAYTAPPIHPPKNTFVPVQRPQPTPVIPVQMVAPPHNTPAVPQQAVLQPPAPKTESVSHQQSFTPQPLPPAPKEIPHVKIEIEDEPKTQNVTLEIPCEDTTPEAPANIGNSVSNGHTEEQGPAPQPIPIAVQSILPPAPKPTPVPVQQVQPPAPKPALVSVQSITPPAPKPAPTPIPVVMQPPMPAPAPAPTPISVVMQPLAPKPAPTPVLVQQVQPPAPKPIAVQSVHQPPAPTPITVQPVHHPAPKPTPTPIPVVMQPPAPTPTPVPVVMQPPAPKHVENVQQVVAAENPGQQNTSEGQSVPTIEIPCVYPDENNGQQNNQSDQSSYTPQQEYIQIVQQPEPQQEHSNTVPCDMIVRGECQVTSDNQGSSQNQQQTSFMTGNSSQSSNNASGVQNVVMAEPVQYVPVQTSYASNYCITDSTNSNPSTNYNQSNTSEHQQACIVLPNQNQQSQSNNQIQTSGDAQMSVLNCETPSSLANSLCDTNSLSSSNFMNGSNSATCDHQNEDCVNNLIDSLTRNSAQTLQSCLTTSPPNKSVVVLNSLALNSSSDYIHARDNVCQE